MNNSIFLLGGKDLEMENIAAALKAAGAEFVYSGARWGVRAANYATEITAAAAEGKTIYLVELDNAPANDWSGNPLPVIDLPEGCVIIDHHGSYAGRLQSILQVLQVIGVEPTREQMLVALNDEGFIPALLAAGLTKAEALEIRYADWMAQEITSEQAAISTEAFANREVIGDLIIVRQQGHSKCAPVTDAAFFEQGQQNLLIVSSWTEEVDGATVAKGELDYYGYNARVEELNASFGGWTGGLTTDNNAFWGIGVSNEAGIHDTVIAYLKSFEAQK